ncbi:hypothetical protein FAUST_7776 [Fusarium austroamericanum]|uniref:Uncharacterized protein n=1 Tax=Fusarium austroamericanum TaxID=282268 RepID=A0AAN5Z5T7_FUSAU|nr:hypothetical protein FAUST_7776 [Fusarium austroamericanum]
MFEESGLALISEILMPLLEGRLLNINEMETLIQWLEFYIEGYIAYSKKQYADLSSGEDLTLKRLKAVDSEAGGIGPHQRDTLLEGIESSVNHRQLRKRVRDDVVLDKSEMPWRTSQGRARGRGEHLREKETPVRYTTADFPGLDPAITRFVATGGLNEGRFMQAFDFMSRTKIGHKFGVGKTSTRLFVSQEVTNLACTENGRSKDLERTGKVLKIELWIVRRTSTGSWSAMAEVFYAPTSQSHLY